MQNAKSSSIIHHPSPITTTTPITLTSVVPKHRNLAPIFPLYLEANTMKTAQRGLEWLAALVWFVTTIRSFSPLRVVPRQLPLPLPLHDCPAAGSATVRSSSSRLWSSSVAAASHNSTTPSTSTPSSSSWYATRIQDTLIDYDQTVERLYLRHILTETRAMAGHAVQLLQSLPLLESTPDPFASAAETLSACGSTRTAGGTIGWVERNTETDRKEHVSGSGSGSSSSENVSQSILSPAVVDAVYALRPKAGDVHIVRDERKDMWHVIHIAEVWMAPPSVAASLTADSSDTKAAVQPDRIGSFGGVNTKTPVGNLKGHGVLPQFPHNLQRYHIQTSGCQMNVADSERLEGILQHDLGLSVADTSKTADLVVVNTCSIRDHAEQKLYDTLGPYAARKRQGQAVAIVVTGCVAQQEGQALLRRVPEIDAVLGPQYIPYLQHVLEQVSTGHQMVVTAPTLLQSTMMTTSTTTLSSTTGSSSSSSSTLAPLPMSSSPLSTTLNVTSSRTHTINDDSDAIPDDITAQPVRGHTVRAWVNTIFGCNEHCTYCVVPGTRGMEQSRTMESILAECLDLSEHGYKEVTLLGQNIDAYGRDMVPKRTFGDLLHYLNAHVPSNLRLRYVTSHPRYFSDRVIDAVATLDKVCECFHMPIQAGDDAVLRRMRRGYTYESYQRIIDKIRAQAPDAAITSDIIVGFPGETEEAFQRTLDMMEYVKFDNVNSFAYSPRPNTEAALWSDQVEESVKAERLQRVQQLAVRHGLERSRRYVGRTEEVLVEDVNPRRRDQVMGRTRQGRQVYFDGSLDHMRGAYVCVKITEANTWSLMGEMVEVKQ